jgi:acylphosphatase
MNSPWVKGRLPDIFAPMRTVRLHAAGKVQGVGYRAWAIRIAVSLGLRGWVRNRTDGTVEMLLTGPDDAVAAMIEASRRGPSGARVSEMRVVDGVDDGSLDFAARPTA